MSCIEEVSIAEGNVPNLSLDMSNEMCNAEAILSYRYRYRCFYTSCGQTS